MADSILDLELVLEETMDELRIDDNVKASVRSFLAVLKQKSEPTYTHSLRVGFLAKRIARFMHLDEKALFFAGVFHDLGKSLTPLDTLHKVTGWTPKDAEIMKSHVVDGHRLLRDAFHFSADIVLWHHRFQSNAYPSDQDIPQPSHEYSLGIKLLIQEYGRILAIADSYDASHRKNDKFEEGRPLTDEEIRQKMLDNNPDRKDLIEELYKADILTQGEADTEEEKRVHEEIYASIWEGVDPRSPQEIARYVMLAAALEPLSDKGGCTTRNTNVSRHLKLEYFITAGINLGEAFRKLAEESLGATTITGRIDIEPPFRIYRNCLNAQRDSLRNRSGGRINQGIIELLVPIIAAQCLYDRRLNFSVKVILRRAVQVLKTTGFYDVVDLISMKRLAFKMSCYFDREVAEYPYTNTVFDYYDRDLYSSTNPTSIAHNREFVQGFPTVELMYNTIMNSSQPSFMRKVEEAFLAGLRNHDKNVGRGFLADCVAVAIYLCLSQHPKIKLIV